MVMRTRPPSRSADLMPTCLVIQHVLPERSFAIGEALADAGVDVDVRHAYARDPLPAWLGADFDGLVVMGGPMSAASDDDFPTRRREIDLLTQALEAGLPTLGVCLGAQLLAAAGGARVIPGGAGLEVGWDHVRFSADAATDPLFATVPSTLRVLHWHGETYELPTGAVHLASSERYRQQAFRAGGLAWGLQFHLEVDEDAVGSFVETFGEDVVAAGTTAEAITEATPSALRALGPHRDEICARFAALVAQGTAFPGEGRFDELADLS